MAYTFFMYQYYKLKVSFLYFTANTRPWVSSTDMSLVPPSRPVNKAPDEIKALRTTLCRRTLPREAFVSVSEILYVGMSQRNEFLPLSLRIAVEPTVPRVAQRSGIFTAVLLTSSPLTVWFGQHCFLPNEQLRSTGFTDFFFLYNRIFHAVGKEVCFA